MFARLIIQATRLFNRYSLFCLPGCWLGDIRIVHNSENHAIIFKEKTRIMPYEALLQHPKFFTAIRASSNMQAVSK